MRRIYNRLIILSAVALLFALTTNATAKQSFQGLGDLPGGLFFSTANGVSADGTVVVGLSISGTGWEAFRWTSGGGLVALGHLPSDTFSLAQAFDVSADGSVVVGISGSEAFRWTSGGGMIGLGDLPGGAAGSTANGVSADGLVVVGRGTSASGNEAFLWTSGGGMVGLGDLAGGTFQSDGKGISDDGLVVVGQGNSVSGNEAFRWTLGDGMVALGDLTGGSFISIANRVSADGSVLFGNGESPSGGEAFRWTSAGGMVPMGDLPGGFCESFGNDVSADGLVVVGSGQGSLGPEAFIWTAETGMQSVRAILVDQLGLDLTGWTLTTARGISADGQTIVGQALNPLGDTEAFVAIIPRTTSCPADINTSGTVNVTDLLALLAAWGTCP